MLNMSNFLELFLLGMLGSVSVEVFKVYELRGKLHYKKYNKLYKSYLFWIVSILFIVISGLLTWIIYEDKTNIEAWQVVFTGMGISSIIKKVLEGVNAQKNLDAGDEEVEITIRDLFS